MIVNVYSLLMDEPNIDNNYQGTFLRAISVEKLYEMVFNNWDKVASYGYEPSEIPMAYTTEQWDIELPFDTNEFRPGITNGWFYGDHFDKVWRVKPNEMKWEFLDTSNKKWDYKYFPLVRTDDNQDYEKDNLSDLDDVIQSAAKDYEVNISSFSMKNYCGCTANEIRNIAFSTLDNITSNKFESDYYKKQIVKLMA